jgi:hypothetical protein
VQSIDLNATQHRNKLCELAAGLDMTSPVATGLPGGHSEWEPPDPFSNSEVKTLCADASVDFVDVKVGHCQALNLMKMKPHRRKPVRFFFACAAAAERLRGPISVPEFA